MGGLLKSLNDEIRGSLPRAYISLGVLVFFRCNWSLDSGTLSVCAGSLRGQLRIDVPLTFAIKGDSSARYFVICVPSVHHALLRIWTLNFEGGLFFWYFGSRPTSTALATAHRCLSAKA